MVELWGLEPQTSCLPGRRSSQLSYSPTNKLNFTAFTPKNKAVTIMPMLNDYLDRLLAGGKERFYGLTVGGGIILLIFTGWLWWHYSYLNPQTVFWAAFNNNLVVSGVTKHTVSGNASTKLDQYDQISLGAHNVVNVVKTVTSSTRTGSPNTTVVTEGIGTPEASYSRYTKLETSQLGPAGQVLNFKPVINQWTRTNVTSTSSGAFADAIFDAFPFASLSARQRQQVVDSSKSDKVYDVDFNSVGKERKNGKLFYIYKVALGPDKYVQLLKQVDSMMNLNQLTGLKPEQYQGAAAIQLTVRMDAYGHQLASVTYTGDARQEEYSGWGAQIVPDIPLNSIKQADLQTKLSAILNGQ
jgi:TM2 domain-containing membrane protein YozV